MIPISRGELHYPPALDATCAKQGVIQVCQVQTQTYREDQCIPEVDHPPLDEMAGDERPAAYSQIEQEHRDDIHIQKARTFPGYKQAPLWR